MKPHCRTLKIILIFLLLIAFGVCCYLVFRPWLTRTGSRREAENAADEFLQVYQTQTPAAQPTAPQENSSPSAPEPESTVEAMPMEELYAAMESYNKQIYAEGQSGLCDPWSYTVPALDLSAYGLASDDAIGVLQIPSIGVSLPIYSGASYGNLAKGAAVLSQTSLPIGGDNTNCVIGAHRGWNAEDYLRDVEEVQLGDEVTVTNFWSELRYTVVEIKVIDPDDIAQILIQEGRELLTVFTCHPYASGGRYRYLLICEREREATAPPAADPTERITLPTMAEQATATPTVCVAGVEFESAAAEIRLVAILPWIGIAILLAVLITVITMLYCKRRE